MAATDDVLLSMRDGVRIAATLYRPEEHGPWPCLVEALPYRKDDVTAGYRDEYHRFADEFGYAVCRVDVRGTGSSEGIATGEYTAEEHADIAEVIAWLAERPWSNGNVGMYGTSWSGFNSLQVAMLRPPALKAICSIFASDDRYADDVHYFGGMLKQLDLVDYPTLHGGAQRPAPGPSDRWAKDGATLGTGGSRRSQPWLVEWLEHQTYDDFWKHGFAPRGLRRDRRHATMLVTGWADGYTNISLRAMAGLDVSEAPARRPVEPRRRRDLRGPGRTSTSSPRWRAGGTDG